MMKFRSTGVMAILVALLAGYTFWEYKHSAEDAEVEMGEHRLFQLLRDDLEEIDLTVKGQTAVLKKSGNDWRMEKPVADDADSSSVEGFVYSLLTQKGKSFRSENEKNTNWAEYGLEPAGSMVEVKGKGRSEKLEVSSKHAFDGSFYIRWNNQLLLGDRGLSQLVEREPNTFRSRKVYRGPEDLERVDVATDMDGVKETYVLKKTGDKEKNAWIMEPSPGFPIDSNKVTLWVQKATGLLAGEFVTESPSDDDRKSFLLIKPSLQLKLSDTQLTFGQNRAEDVFVATNRRPTIYKFASLVLDSLRVPKIYFRDGHVSFKFDLQLIREVAVQTDKMKSVFLKTDSNWSLKDGDKGSELDSDKLVSFFQNLQSLEAQEWLKNGTGFPATPQVVLKGADGKPIFTLSWGDEYKSRASYNKSTPLRYVRLSPGQEIYAVSKDKLDRLVDSAMIKKKESK